MKQTITAFTYMIYVGSLLIIFIKLGVLFDILPFVILHIASKVYLWIEDFFNDNPF